MKHLRKGHEIGFLNAYLEEEYVEQPTGFIMKGCESKVLN